MFRKWGCKFYNNLRTSFILFLTIRRRMEDFFHLIIMRLFRKYSSIFLHSALICCFFSYSHRANWRRRHGLLQVSFIKKYGIVTQSCKQGNYKYISNYRKSGGWLNLSDKTKRLNKNNELSLSCQFLHCRHSVHFVNNKDRKT